MNNYVKLLKAARVKIASGKEIFLCNALKAAADESMNVDMKKAAEKLVNRIMTKLTTDNEYIFTVDGWLKRNSIEFREWSRTVRGNHEYIREMREYRLLWIDALIAEYQKLK